MLENPAFRKELMNPLHQKSVLVLDCDWRVTNVTSPEVAITNMSKDAVTAVLCHGENDFEVVTWDRWLTLPVAEDEEAIRTIKLRIKIPHVIIAVNYREARRVMKRPKPTPKEMARVYEGRDFYTGEYIGRRGTRDHLHPQSKGGEDTWENMVWTAPEINQLKGDMSFEEFIRKYPEYRPKFRVKVPGYKPKAFLIEPRSDRPIWNHFLARN